MLAGRTFCVISVIQSLNIFVNGFIFRRLDIKLNYISIFSKLLATTSVANTRFWPCPYHCSLLPTYLTARFSPALKWFKKTIENDRSCETSGHFLQSNLDTFYPWLKLRINSWIKFWNFRKIWKLLFLISWDNSEPTLPAITCLKV